MPGESADLPIRAEADGVRLRVRLTPRGGRDAIEGIARLSDGSAVLLARVRAVPEAGAANAALIRLVADMLDVRASAVEIEAGATGRIKILRIRGEEEAILTRFGAIVAQ
jgi:hypothetical protein